MRCIILVVLLIYSWHITISFISKYQNFLCRSRRKKNANSGENSESAAAGTFTRHNFIFVIWSFDQGSAWAQVFSIFYYILFI